MAEEDQQQQGRKEDAKDGEHAYKTKIIQFFGRSTPIVLQNGNGPCPPLLAICNVLLLRNAINLNADSSEISPEELLSLVAGRLIDSSCNFTDKDDGYANNQLKNIDDAMKILSKLASRIDVNIQFRKIDDFDITSECVIFDLLDIGLYHGWIVDPQDTDTATAIGSKSYNTLVRELVSLKAVGEEKGAYEEDAIDFIAATTATLGVPSPCLLRGMSFDDPPVLVPHEQRRRGDLNEAEKLLRASYLSRTDLRTTCTESASPDINWSSGENLSIDCSEPIYEGEECILDSRVTVYEEPIYEGEMVLAEQSNKRADQDACASSNNASQQQ
ncbi:hypothetical protein QJS04_geneDACA000920 [Acorus gramineus]|uniref:MINDY deubiquitinase domain-containing protein n=1 Tax=Acorus gramineus TaxID=55184 RepID=A0AAV9ABS5_ACOGR|nr:hypothetical protein QJS04_geneDACA000920 [Acorus gramineus]